MNCELSYSTKLSLPNEHSNETIRSLALSPNQQNLLISTNFNQIYQFQFTQIVLFLLFKIVLWRFCFVLKGL